MEQKNLATWICRKMMILAMLMMLVSLIAPNLVSQSRVHADSDEPIKIGILQYVEHDALDAAREGFIETLEASELADRITFDIQNANGDMSSLQSLAEKLARDNDILYAIATPAAQGLAAVESQKPIFFAAVTDPEAAELVVSNDAPGRNVTGVSDLSPIEAQVELLTENFPEVERVGIIYNSSEVNSQVLAQLAQEELTASDIDVEIATVVASNDIQPVLTALLNKIDALFLITDNTIDNAITLVGDLAKEAQIPAIGSSEDIIRANGLATISNSYHNYGRQVGEMVIRSIEEDLPAGDQPVEFAQEFELVVNEDVAKALSVDPNQIVLPEGLDELNE